MVEGDLAVPKDCLEGAEAPQGQKTGEFASYCSPAGYLPHLSWTEGVVGTVQELVKKIPAVVHRHI